MLAPRPSRAATPEELAQAAKLIDDPIYFIESIFTILNKDSKEVPFKINHAQQTYWAERTHKDIILKARKMGFSTFIIALWLHACFAQKNQRAIIVSHEKESTERLLQRAIFMLEHAAIAINWRRRGDTIIFPDTGSWLYIGTAGARAFGRGDDITHAHLSEPAFYEKLDIVAGVQEALVNNAWFVLESTANGAGTPYHEIWKRAEEKLSDIKTHFYAWWRDPGYRVKGAVPVELTDNERKHQRLFNLDWEQLAWWRDKLRSMVDPKLFPQEYPAYPDEAFLASGRMVFDWEAVKIHEENAVKPKWIGRLDEVSGDYRLMPEEHGHLEVFETPALDGAYLITGDAALGVPGGDLSVADVWNLRTGAQAAQWRGHMPTDDFASKVMFRLGAYYNWAIIAQENNYPGNAVEIALRNALKYPNLWMDPTKRGRTVETGFKSTEALKAAMVSDAQKMLRELDIKVNSKYTLTELKTYVVKDDGTIGATEGCNDDTTTTLMAACYIMRRVIVPEAGAVVINRGRRSIESYRAGRGAPRAPGSGSIV